MEDLCFLWNPVFSNSQALLQGGPEPVRLALSTVTVYLLPLLLSVPGYQAAVQGPQVQGHS